MASVTNLCGFAVALHAVINSAPSRFTTVLVDYSVRYWCSFRDAQLVLQSRVTHVKLKFGAIESDNLLYGIFFRRICNSGNVQKQHLAQVAELL